MSKGETWLLRHIKNEARKIKKSTGCNHSAALDRAAVAAGHPSYHHARKAELSPNAAGE